MISASIKVFNSGREFTRNFTPYNIVWFEKSTKKGFNTMFKTIDDELYHTKLTISQFKQGFKDNSK